MPIKSVRFYSNYLSFQDSFPPVLRYFSYLKKNLTKGMPKRPSEGWNGTGKKPSQAQALWVIARRPRLSYAFPWLRERVLGTRARRGQGFHDEHCQPRTRFHGQDCLRGNPVDL